jgi:hypothetical protein
MPITAGTDNDNNCPLQLIAGEDVVVWIWFDVIE